MQRKNLSGYWRSNVIYVLFLLAIWFLVSYGCGILFAEPLNKIRLGGFKLGFWFAQQGSIYVFVILIFVYVWLMNRLDKKWEVDEEEAPAPGRTSWRSRRQADKNKPSQPNLS